MNRLPVEALLNQRRVLLLQGPMGSFFNRVGHWLRSLDIEVYKVNLNGGDWLFHRGPGALSYRGRLEDFGLWLEGLLRHKRIDALVCFGDCRAYHRLAAKIAAARALPLYVFEEGYVRPDYITLEVGGVNAHSQLAMARDQLLRHEPLQPPEPLAARPSFRRMALSAIGYYAAGWLLRRRYPHYQHHKDFSPLRECGYWLRSGLRKVMYRWQETAVIRRIHTQLAQSYFLVPLQVFNDSQILHHSPYGDIREFIMEVMTSFAQHANAEHHLVFKHHPMDRGHRNYRQLIAKLAQQHQVGHRVHYIHDTHLPSLLKTCAGVVTINSTVGLSALHHGKPLIAMGRAFYDCPGLTAQHGLDEFWHAPSAVNQELYKKLRSCMIRHSQLNGAFYGHSHWMRAHSNMAKLRDPLNKLFAAAARDHCK